MVQRRVIVQALLVGLLHARGCVGWNALLPSTCHRGSNRLFLETADTDIWKDVLPVGMFHGVTTDPLLLAQANEACTVGSLHALARTALSTPGCQEMVLHAYGGTTDQLYDVGMQLSQPNRAQIVVAVPMTVRGVEAAAHLIQSGVRVALHSATHPKQALVAAGLGAEYFMTNWGHLVPVGDTTAASGTGIPQTSTTAASTQSAAIQDCRTMQAILTGMNSRTRLLVTGIRTAAVLQELVLQNTISNSNYNNHNCFLESFSFPPQVARELFQEPRTDRIAAQIEAATRQDPSNTYNNNQFNQ